MNFNQSIVSDGRTASNVPAYDTGIEDLENAEKRQRFLSLHSFERVWRLALINKWWVLGIMAICIAIGLLITLLSTPLYSATSRIEISRQQANVTNVQGVDDGDRTRDMEFYDTQYSLLAARSLADRVVRSLGLASQDEFFATFGEEPGGSGGDSSLGGVPRSSGQQRVDRQRDAAKILLDHVSISPIRGSSLVDISFTSPDPSLSAKVANAWVSQFVEANLARRYASTTDARDFLEKRLNTLRDKLEGSESQLVNYASANGIVKVAGDPDSDTERTLVSSDLVAVSKQLVDARSDRIAAQSAYQQTRGARDSLNNQAINLLRQNRAMVASERAKLLSTFEPDYPAVVALTAQLKQLDASLSREEARVQDTAADSYREAVQREQELKAQLNTLKNRLVSENRDSIQYNIFKREVDTNRQLYDALLQRYKEIGVAGVGANNIAVVDQAEVPQRPSSPRLALNMLLSIIAGMAFSGGFLFARDQLDQTLRDPNDVTRMLKIPQLGVIPNFGTDPVEDALEDRKSIASEAYFSIATNLSFLTGHGVPRSLVFTSSRPNEGKTTSALAIAIMLQRIGKRVLLVDADMRNPSLHKLVGISNSPGLSNYLAGDDELSSMIRTVDPWNVSVMAAGPIPPSPAELLSDVRLSQLFARLAENFDHVVVDGPPVLGLADAPILASQVEGSIFAIEANGAKLRNIQLALDRLAAAKANVYGAIVTKVDSRNSAYGYGQDYGYVYESSGED